jgi:beta-carotene hydroxylase
MSFKMNAAPITANERAMERSIPTLKMLGPELLTLTVFQRLRTIALPFVYAACYYACALAGFWIPAVIALMALSFVTYGSTSHDLVHRNLGLPRRLNDLLLSIIELLALRSGTAYRIVHLHHHASYPHRDDVEAMAARMGLLRTLFEGTVFVPRVYLWAWRHAPQARCRLLLEGIACLTIAAVGVLLFPVTPVLLVYVLLMIAGSWIIPLITSYIPHTPGGKDELSQTRVFRGVIASIVAVEHLYHLEHHLYPAVPHHNWPRLAKKLDPYLEQAGVPVVRLWF